jgi:hypothetical protein
MAWRFGTRTQRGEEDRRQTQRRIDDPLERWLGHRVALSGIKELAGLAMLRMKA